VSSLKLLESDSAAVVTDISLNADPEQRARDWVKATRGICSQVQPHG